MTFALHPVSSAPGFLLLSVAVVGFLVFVSDSNAQTLFVLTKNTN